MNYYINKSKIHGNGVFSNKNIKKNTIIGLVIDYYFNLIPFRTNKLGLYLNHYNKYNCKLIYKDSRYYLIAIKNIKKNTELTIDYDDTPWFIAGTWHL